MRVGAVVGFAATTALPCGCILVQMRPGMDESAGSAPPNAVKGWDGALRLREPIAWVLLALAAVGVAVGAWELFGLPGSPRIAVPIAVAVPASAGAGAGAGAAPIASVTAASTFAVRASAVAPQFVAAELFALPIVSIVLVAFAGGLTDRARRVVDAALALQIVTLGLGLSSWLATFGAHQRAGIWFVADASELAILAAALAFTVALRRSPALRPDSEYAMDGTDVVVDVDDDDELEVLGGAVCGRAFEDIPDEFEGLRDESP